MLALPPKSFVLYCFLLSTCSIAFSIFLDASLKPKWSNIMAADHICPIGLAIPFPAISGAEPCTGSNNEGNFLSGLIFPDGAIPIVPVHAGPRSDKISPKIYIASNSIFIV